MEFFLIGLIVFLLIMSFVLTISYERYVKAANDLVVLGESIEKAFEGVVAEISKVNSNVNLMLLQNERTDEAIEVLNSNDAVIELYLNLFRDALGIKADKLSRVGTINYPEPKT